MRNDTFDRVEDLLIDIFGKNPYHARAKLINDEVSYSPSEFPISINDITDHLNGSVVLGSYQLVSEDQVYWLGWDIDSPDREKAKIITAKISKVLENIPHAVEYSGRRGYHILIFADKPLPAGRAKRFVDRVREMVGAQSSGETHVECFPKQDRLTKSRPKGNLLKIPLGVHPKTKDRSKFIDPMAGWETGPVLDPIPVLQERATEESIFAVLNEIPKPDLELAEMLSEYWTEGRRHEFSLYLSGFLIAEGWGVDQTEQLITSICKISGDGDTDNRIQTVKTTYERYKEGKTIRGRQGLGEILPVTVLQRMQELVSLIRAPNSVLQIDDIRFNKSKSKIENVRLAANTIWTMLNDDGCRIFQTNSRETFWYNSEDHSVTRSETDKWLSILNKKFGYNSKDSFSTMMEDELKLRSVREAPYVDVRLRNYWDDTKKELYINLGGPEVYILDGSEIRKTYNGECGIMFVTNPNGKYIVPDFVTKHDIFDCLVNDLSFTQSNEAPARPEEQRELLKIWSLAFFFQELMPTKPILTLLGVPGSGKTTAMRRFVKMFEGEDSDVLSVPPDKPDAFRASISSHRLLVMDNLEKSGSHWMVDVLNKLSTGALIELRELYKTNSKITIYPSCFVALTAVSIPFSEETLYSRMLVLEMDTLENPAPENVLQREMKEKEVGMWNDLIDKLNVVVAEIRKDLPCKSIVKSRMVDFTSFCERIKRCSFINATKLDSGLNTMIDSQLAELKESSQAVQLLEEWITAFPKDASEWHTISEVYVILTKMASSRSSGFGWKTPQALSRHLGVLEPRLKKDFFAEIDFEISPVSNKAMKIIRFRNDGMVT